MKKQQSGLGFYDQFYLFLRNLLILDKHSIVFSLLFLSISLLVVYGANILSGLSFLKSYLFLLDIYFLILLYVYKFTTNVTEENLRRVSFQAVVLIGIVHFLSFWFVLSNTLNPSLFIIGSLLGELPFIMVTSLALFGYIYLLYHGFKKMNFLRLSIVAIFIAIASQAYDFYIGRFSFLFSPSLLIKILSGVFLVIAYTKIMRAQFNFKNSTSFFIIFGFVLFFFELANGLIVDYSSGRMLLGYDYFGLFFINFESFLLSALWAVYFYFKQENSRDHT